MSKYISLAKKHQDKHKIHIVLTSPLSGNQYEVMEHIVAIRNKFNKLLTNLKLIDLYNFENIELGKNYDNPHLDIQLWLNKKDSNKIQKVYNKILDTYSLRKSLCTFNPFDEEISDIKIFYYAVKEYSNFQSDEIIYKLGNARKHYRINLNRNVRFFSHTRNTYTQKIYKELYKRYGLTYKEVEYVLDNEIIQIKENNKLSLNLKAIRKLKKRHLVNILNKLSELCEYNGLYKQIDKGGNRIYVYWCYWVYGFI